MSASSVINKDFLLFTQLQVLTDDVDPAYPYIKYYIRDYSDNDKLKFILDYMSSYSLGSTLYYYDTGKILMTPTGNPLTGIERRNNRTLDRMLNDLSQNEMRVYYVKELLYKLKTYSESVFMLSKLNNYGRWAAFKLTEILDYVFELNLVCDNLFTEKGSGHSKGLTELSGLKATEQNAKEVFSLYQEEYPDYKYQNYETSLCDWHNVVAGNYYVGNDIDLLKKHLIAAGQFDNKIHSMLYPNYPTEHTEDVIKLRKLYQKERVIQWWK